MQNSPPQPPSYSLDTDEIEIDELADDNEQGEADTSEAESPDNETLTVAKHHKERYNEEENAKDETSATFAVESTAQPQATTAPTDAWKLRLRTLKQKMNQARQLNHQAVLEEGERLSRGIDVERSQQKRVDQEREKEQRTARHSKALILAASHGLEGKHMTQQAFESIRNARVRMERAEASQFSNRDYYNPEGQALNYQKNLKSLPNPKASSVSTLPSTSTSTSTASYNPLDQYHPHSTKTETELDQEAERERQGVRRLADELHRRIGKQKEKQLKRSLDKDDDSSQTAINKRNKMFNQKINRNYDPHTAEIRHNLERGTAL